MVDSYNKRRYQKVTFFNSNYVLPKYSNGEGNLAKKKNCDFILGIRNN